MIKLVSAQFFSENHLWVSFTNTQVMKLCSNFAKIFKFILRKQDPPFWHINTLFTKFDKITASYCKYFIPCNSNSLSVNIIQYFVAGVSQLYGTKTSVQWIATFMPQKFALLNWWLNTGKPFSFDGGTLPREKGCPFQSMRAARNACQSWVMPQGESLLTFIVINTILTS